MGEDAGGSPSAVVRYGGLDERDEVRRVAEGEVAQLDELFLVEKKGSRAVDDDFKDGALIQLPSRGGVQMEEDGRRGSGARGRHAARVGARVVRIGVEGAEGEALDDVRGAR